MTQTLLCEAPIRFIGNKYHSVQLIVDAIRKVSTKSDFVADLFCGTATVSKGLRTVGKRVLANDILHHCIVGAKAKLLVKNEPEFTLLVRNYKQLRSLKHSYSNYGKVLRYLNSLNGIEGFFYKNYSPEGTSHLEIPRQYFTAENAKKIDAIRHAVKCWRREDAISEYEHALLLYDLMRAASKVANIAGTYHCFLKDWYDRALDPLWLEPSNFTSARTDHIITQQNANTLVRKMEFDIVYIDPPYTKRQYGAYYHILETIAAEDNPKISGKIGLRPWEDRASDYCYKRRAAVSLEDLVKSISAKHIFLSYSEDGHISHEEILNILSTRGKANTIEIAKSRYKSNNGGDKERVLKERLYHVRIIR